MTKRRTDPKTYIKLDSSKAEAAKIIKEVMEDSHRQTRKLETDLSQPRRGWGTHLPDGIDGYDTDEYGNPIPKLTKEEIFTARRTRICPAYPYCKEKPAKDNFACQYHWYMLPPTYRTRIWNYSTWYPHMEKLKPVVFAAVYWLHSALGPDINPTKVSDRAIELLGKKKPTESCLRKVIEQSVKDAMCVKSERDVTVRDVANRIWKTRLDFIWR